MCYTFSPVSAVAGRPETVDSDLGTQSIRFGDALFQMADEPRWGRLAKAARGLGAALKHLSHSTPRRRLHMVVQQGRLFQQEHPDDLNCMITIYSLESTLMATIEKLGHVRFHGMLGEKDISAVAFWSQRVLVVADEVTDRGNVVQAFEKDDADFRAVSNGLTVLDVPAGQVEEMDLEGIAVDGQTVFVLGSHSSRRKKVDAEKAYVKNRAALMSPPEAQPARDVLLRFDLDAAGKAGPIERTSLRGFLNATEPFRSIRAMASKENGIDAEGLAVRDQRLYIGFRGPVLRGNFTPILRCRFGSPIGEPEVLFVNLGGRGVRDLARVEGGLLILAGPVGDGPGSYQLYLWDGRDGVPGTGAPTSAADPGLRLIGDLPIPPSNSGDHKFPAKPEGVALIKETSHHWEILIVFDGLKDGHATRFRVDKP